MSLLRLIFYGFLFYFVYKFVKNFIQGKGQKTKVKGKRKGNPPLNLRDEDIEDADYEELNN
jgi:hypothetical protein